MRFALAFIIKPSMLKFLHYLFMEYAQRRANEVNQSNISLLPGRYPG